MIMARNEDGTYSQVGFVKDNAGIDTEYIYDKDGDIVFEKGFTRETSGTVPLTINGIGKGLKSWSITGNTVQNSGTYNISSKSVTVVGIENETNNAKFNISDFPSIAVGDKVTFVVNSQSYSLSVIKVDSNYVYIQNQEV